MTAAGGQVHWARDAAEANARRRRRRARPRRREVVKVKSLTTDEIGLNDALAAAGIHALETDFAELILQLDGDWSSHILVPAIHRNRTRDPRPLRAHDRRPGSTPTTRATLAEASRALPARAVPATRKVGVSGANFGVAETGTLVRRRVRGQRPHVHDAAAGAGHDPRDREAGADASPTSRSSCSCCRAPRPASG